MEQAAPGMTAPVFGRRDPDGRGYFGPYGGRFVPETLVEPIEQLERAYREARDDPAFSAELSELLTHYVGRETPLYEAVRLTADAGGGAGVPQARGPRAHGRTQDQQRVGAGPARETDGQASCGGRDGRRSAWRRNGHGVCAHGARVRGLHGHRGYAPTGTQRVSDATPRGDGHRCRFG